MAVQFLTGKPGGGKTLFAVKLIVNQLVEGKKRIITNVPINLGRLNEYLQEKHPNIDTCCVQRIRKLTDEETFTFFRYRGGDPDLILPVNGDKIDYTKAFECGPVMYVLDELHMFFNAREWAKTGKAALSYLSQHRHLGDDIICITQSIRNVDKQFRSIAQDFTHLRNYSKEKFYGLRMPSRFVFRTYLTEQEGDAKSPMVTGSFKLDVSGLASCYDTSAGVGLVGVAEADKSDKTKGLSIWWLAVVIFAICGLLWYLPTTLYSKVQKSVQYNPQQNAETNIVHENNNQQVTVQEKTEDKKDIKIKEELPYITGFTVLGKKVRVYLSDGQEVTEKSAGVQLISDRILIRSNIVYKFKQNVPRGTLAGNVPTYPNN